MPRPLKGTLILTAKGWAARVPVTIDGERVKQWFPLGTGVKAVARRKLARLINELEQGERPTQEQAAAPESFQEAAERLVEASSIASKQRRLDRLRLHVYPHIGHMPVDKVRAADVSEVLQALADKGRSRQLCTHVKNDIGAVLGELWRAEVLPENVVARVRVPKAAVQDTRERAVLTDDELVRYLAWQHPDERFRRAVLERQTMACVSRIFGGLRLGDLRALRWEAFQVAGEEFVAGWAPRKKTKRPQLLEVPAMLRPILKDWWERAGRPSEGLLFPVGKGERAGEQRKPSSPAKALRRDLMRALSIEVPKNVTVPRANGRPLTRLVWERARELTPRERELFEETEFTRPVEFHSFRRAFKQGLADAGVDVQQAMTLSGATDMKVHQRYLNNTAKMRQVPAAALPRLDTANVQTLSGNGSDNHETAYFPEREKGLEPSTPSLGSLATWSTRVILESQNSTKDAGFDHALSDAL